MSEWKLKDCCLSISDGDHLPPPKSDCGIPFITISNIDSTNHIDFSNTLFVPTEYYDNLDSIRKAQPDDIIYSVVGSFGKPVLIKENKKFVFQRHIAILRPNNEIVDSRYLYYIMLSRNFYMQADSVAVGAAQRTISLTSLRNMKVNLPELSIQQHIATALSRYDSLIENYQKQIKLLEESAQRFYKEWFIDLRFPGHENTKIVDGVPEGWKKKKLMDIADVVMGQSPKSEFYNSEKKGLPFHQGVGSYGFRFVDDNVYSSSLTRIAEPNSILFSVRAPVGRLNFTKNKIVIGRGLAAMNHKNGSQSYLFYLLKERFFKDDIIGNGAIFASISKDELLNQIFIVPNDKLVSQFNSIVNKMDNSIQSIDTQIRHLTEARDRLLPKLMNGEIEV
ncbi:MAG: restriction endonuclease subunit S [Bacteroidales bacterium]|nr:restriction endonuclease subunit S [Bacteroidales bacterium]